MKKLSIIIPAYNEERSISQILGKIHQTRLIGETEKEILIIDDGSKIVQLKNAGNSCRPTPIWIYIITSSLSIRGKEQR